MNDPMLLQELGRASAPSALCDNQTLFVRWHEHRDQGARQELIHRFMPLARKLASRYMNPHELFEDLIQVASIGLLGAVDRFDPNRGVKFPSFAIPSILGELKRHFRGTAWSVHVPRRVQELALQVDKATREIVGTSGRAPSVQTLSEYLELSTEDVITGLDAGAAHYSVSLDAPQRPAEGESEPEALGDQLGDEDERFGMVDAALSLSAAFANLPQPERQALSLRVNHDMKQSEIARRLGCSQMQVSRLLRRATSRLTELIEPAPVQRGD